MKESTQKITDEELVLRSRNGDKQALDELVARYADLVRRRARGFFLVDGETEDLIQEGMMGLYGAVLDYRQNETGKSFKNFAYLCVSRRIYDAVKRSKSKKNEPLNNSVSETLADFWASEVPSPEDEMILSDERKEFRQKMTALLSDFEFKIFTMYIDGMSCTEICETTGKSVKSVDNAIQRSKRKLQPLVKRKRND